MSQAEYERYHRRRYERLLADVPPAAKAILDVGPNAQTTLLRARFPAARVTTLGYAHPHHPGHEHVEADLDAPPYGEPTPHEAIVFAEVLEHLHTAPQLVLGELRRWLAPEGVLILQTPNAVALHKRVRMLAGRNPIEPIREDRTNPGHFHEYTLRELREAAAAAGLRVAGVSSGNWFGASRAYAALGRALPPSLRHGLQLTLQ